MARIHQLLGSLYEWPIYSYRVKLFYLHGQPVERVQAWIDQAWRATIYQHLFRGWPLTIDRLRQQDIEIVLMSGTPRPLAQPLMQLLGLDDAICAEPEIHSGVYTGRLLSPHPRDKWKFNYAATWMRAHGHNMEHTVAIANDWPDRHLLTACQAVVVQPHRRLRSLARLKNWPIVDNPNVGGQLIDAIQRQIEAASR